MTKFKYIFLLSLSLLGCAGFWPFGERDEFITVRGTHFIHNDQPYYFVGTNLWYASYLGSPSIHGDRPRLLRELDSLQSIGITNIRLLAGSELTSMERTLKPSITYSQGKYDDSLQLGLDFALTEMSKRKMKAVLFLTNYWEWSGGMAQYITWADSIPTFSTDSNGWDAFMDFSASFYKNEKANALFRSYIKHIVTRKNKYSGNIYGNDPVIMSWQLANEPRIGTISPEGYKNIPNFIRWIDETAGFIRLLDSNHLISTGSEGIIGSLRNEELYRASHMSNNIDYMTMHLWPSMWRWYDPHDQDKTFPMAMDSSVNYISQSLQCARMIRKPIVLEEFGMIRDNGEYTLKFPTTVRDEFFRKVLQLVYDSARAGAPIAGTNFWAWGGEGRTKNPNGMWNDGDQFTGDPPHEAQGKHSIFNTDLTTISILREYSLKMNTLRTIDTLFVQQ